MYIILIVFLFFLNSSVTLSNLLEIKHNTEEEPKIKTLNSIDSTSTSLSVPEREAFEIFLIDNQNKNEIDFYCKALKQKYEAAKGIATKIEECQKNITDIRKNLEHASNNYELYQELNSQIIEVQNVYRENLLQLQQIKSEIEMLKHGLKQAQIKVVQKFKRWFGKKESVALDLVGMGKASVDVIGEKLHQKTDHLLETDYLTTIHNNFEFPNVEIEEKNLGIFHQETICSQINLKNNKSMEENDIKTKGVNKLKRGRKAEDFPSTSKTPRSCIENNGKENLRQVFDDQIKTVSDYFIKTQEEENLRKTITKNLEESSYSKEINLENTLNNDLKSFTDYLKIKSKFETMKEATINFEEAEEVLKHNSQPSLSFSSAKSDIDLEIEEKSFITAKKSTKKKTEFTKGNIEFFADIIKQFKNPFKGLSPKELREIKTETLYSKPKSHFEEKSSINVSFDIKQNKKKCDSIVYKKSEINVEANEPENNVPEKVTQKAIKPRYNDPPEFVEFMKTIPLTGDIEVDEEIWCFYRNKFKTN